MESGNETRKTAKTKKGKRMAKQYSVAKAAETINRLADNNTVRSIAQERQEDIDLVSIVAFLVKAIPAVEAAEEAADYVPAQTFERGGEFQTDDNDKPVGAQTFDHLYYFRELAEFVEDRDYEHAAILDEINNAQTDEEIDRLANG